MVVFTFAIENIRAAVLDGSETNGRLSINPSPASWRSAGCWHAARMTRVSRTQSAGRAELFTALYTLLRVKAMNSVVLII